MIGVAVSINEMKRRHEKIVRVMELQTRLLPRFLARDLTALGQLILEVGLPACRLSLFALSPISTLANSPFLATIARRFRRLYGDYSRRNQRLSPLVRAGL